VSPSVDADEQAINTRMVRTVSEPKRDRFMRSPSGVDPAG
jgi:hypothetical protein